MCYCPPNIEPPTAELARCRLILQSLAGGIFMVSLFALIAGNFFFVFHALIISYVLYLSWATFDYCLTLYIFFISIMEAVMCYIQLIYLYVYSYLGFNTMIRFKATNQSQFSFSLFKSSTTLWPFSSATLYTGILKIFQ